MIFVIQLTIVNTQLHHLQQTRRNISVQN